MTMHTDHQIDSQSAVRSSKQQAGFTLIEVLVALTVTVIGLMGLLSLHTTTLKGNRDASRTAEATTIAQRTIEEVRTMAIDDGTVNSIVGKYGPISFTDVPMDTAFGRAGITYTRSLSVEELTSISEDLVRIRVVVEWADGGDDPSTVAEIDKHKISLELVRTRQEAL